MTTDGQTNTPNSSSCFKGQGHEMNSISAKTTILLLSCLGFASGQQLGHTESDLIVHWITPVLTYEP